MFFVAISRAMLTMFSPSPSLVEMAMTTGRRFRSWALAAISTALSVMALASLLTVLPVQGAITSTSSVLFGPSGSASTIEEMISFPVRSFNCFRQSSALPKRVSVVRSDWEMIGMTFAPASTNRWICGITSSKVQWEPDSANPTVLSLQFNMHPSLSSFFGKLPAQHAGHDPAGRPWRHDARQTRRQDRLDPPFFGKPEIRSPGSGGQIDDDRPPRQLRDHPGVDDQRGNGVEHDVRIAGFPHQIRRVERRKPHFEGPGKLVRPAHPRFHLRAERRQQAGQRHARAAEPEHQHAAAVNHDVGVLDRQHQGPFGGRDGIVDRHLVQFEQTDDFNAVAGT